VVAPPRPDSQRSHSSRFLEIRVRGCSSGTPAKHGDRESGRLHPGSAPSPVRGPEQNGAPGDAYRLQLEAKQIPATTLNAATAHRIDQQIKRAFRHTYGAESGLRTLVRRGVEEMLRAGASPQEIRDALVARMQNHPAPGKPSLLTGESRATVLTRLMIAWADEVCSGAPVTAE
jgi:hypothetical protein